MSSGFKRSDRARSSPPIAGAGDDEEDLHGIELDSIVPPETGFPGSHLTRNPARDDFGTLVLKRTGKVVTALGSDGANPILELGAVYFGDAPVGGIRVQVAAENTSSALDVRFERIELSAEKLTPLEQPEPLSVHFPWAWVITTAVVLSLWWALRRLRSRST